MFAKIHIKSKCVSFITYIAWYRDRVSKLKICGDKLVQQAQCDVCKMTGCLHRDRSQNVLLTDGGTQLCFD